MKIANVKLLAALEQDFPASVDTLIVTKFNIQWNLKGPAKEMFPYKEIWTKQISFCNCPYRQSIIRV